MCLMALLESATRSKKIAIISYSFAALIMVFLASARDGVGTDWDAYLNFYQNTEESQRVEIGYSSFNDVFSYINAPYNMFLLAMNIVCIGLVTSFFRRFNTLSVVAILVFYSDLFLYFNLSGMRQAIATALTCYALRYVISRQPLQFILAIVIAATFHLSAIIFLLAYLVPKYFTKKLFFGLIFFGFLVYKFIDPIADFFTEYTIKNAAFYLDDLRHPENIISSYYIGMARRFVVFGFIAIGWRDLRDKFHFQYIVNLYIIGVSIYVATYLISPDAGVRISTYFTVLDAVILSLVIWQKSTVSIRLGLTAIVCAMCIYKLIGYASNPFYSYQTFFFNM